MGSHIVRAKTERHEIGMRKRKTNITRNRTAKNLNELKGNSGTLPTSQQI